MKIEQLIDEAIELQNNIKRNKKRLDELKNLLKESTAGKNASYKTISENGSARFTKRKEKITSSFDEEKYLKLDYEKKNQLIQNQIINENVNYSLDLAKAKDFHDQNLIKSIMRENYKESYFTVTISNKKK